MLKQNFKFQNIHSMFQCPLCKQVLHFANESSLVCKSGHCFDISSKGYVNFVSNQKPLKGYNSMFFEKRREFLENGFYDHIVNAIADIILAQGNILRIVDAGCGDGFYSQNLAKRTGADFFAFDFSKDAIKVASKGWNEIYWMVADIANIPLPSGSMNCILNIFSPANYSEFQRVSAPDSILVKAIPGKNHMRELRYVVHGQLRNAEYSNQQVINNFKRHLILVDRKLVNRTIVITRSQIQTLLSMTPLLFNVENEKIDCSDVTSITVESEILVGQFTSSR